jgi:hypothetical protein
MLSISLELKFMETVENIDFNDGLVSLLIKSDVAIVLNGSHILISCI